MARGYEEPFYRNTLRKQLLWALAMALAVIGALFEIGASYEAVRCQQEHNGELNPPGSLCPTSKAPRLVRAAQPIQMRCSMRRSLCHATALCDSVNGCHGHTASRRPA